MDKNSKTHCLIVLYLLVFSVICYFWNTGQGNRLTNIESAVTEHAGYIKKINEDLYGQIGPVMQKIVTDLYGSEIIAATEEIKAPK